MFGINRWWWNGKKALLASVIVALISIGLVSCGDRIVTAPTLEAGSAPTQLARNISEVSPPAVIQELRQALEIYQPQVSILSPKSDAVLQDNTVSVELQVRDLPIFKNESLELGPHLHLILDNQPYIAVYDVNQPVILNNLEPGTHTLRVFASRPWHESFKNEGAYAQTTFHIFTKTQDNAPDSALALLTYSRPKGDYGAEPIMLDFYLTNAPLHLVAQENPNDNISDWRIRVTVNGENFLLDRWEPIYLKGLKRGQNWVQLEYLDEQGNPVKNAFNNTVRLIHYEPNGKDTLSKIVRGEVSAAQVRGIIDPTYQPEILVPEPTVQPTPTPSPELTSPEELTPSAPPEVIPTFTPVPEATEVPVEPELPSAAEIEPAPVEPLPSSDAAVETQPSVTAAPETQIELETPVAPSGFTPTQQPEKPKSLKFLERFRRNKATEVTPETIPTPTVAPAPVESNQEEGQPKVEPGEPGYLPEIVPELEPTPVLPDRINEMATEEAPQEPSVTVDSPDEVFTELEASDEES